VNVRNEGHVAAAERNTAELSVASQTTSRRGILAGAAAVGVTILTDALPAAAQESKMKKSFTILHTNDMHSAFIGMAPSSDYTPFTLNDDSTQGRVCSTGWFDRATEASTREPGARAGARRR
jgi:2',3'-cyclic-nucleotide 2'-phosphodiesterase (5'-nucleotidase family)